MEYAYNFFPSTLVNMAQRLLFVKMETLQHKWTFWNIEIP